MKIDYIHFYVEDAKEWRNWFVHTMGFQPIARGNNFHTHTEVIQNGCVKFVLSSPLTAASPVADYLCCHSPGVADVAFEVSHLEQIWDKITFHDETILQPLQTQHFAQGKVTWGQVMGKGVRHTLLQREGITPILPEEGIVSTSIPEFPSATFAGIDHIVLNVAAGDLEKTATWYENQLGFERQQTFTIQTKRSGLYSQVLVHPASGVQLPINEPLSPNSQIQEFLDVNRGAGIQHIALKTPSIVQVTTKMREAGLPFLHVPPTYYSQLWQEHPEIHFLASEWDKIQQQQILIDCQQNLEDSTLRGQPLLLQIFTQPIFGQPTFFFELIERRWQAQGFGEGNFRALFEAIEREQLKRGSLS